MGDQAGAHKRFFRRRNDPARVRARDDQGWRLNGAAIEGLERLVDLDYGFTPATNVLHLSRVALKPDQRAEVPVAWFDLDSASLIALP